MELHDIRLIVGSFLGTHDLCSCVRVSKPWHESFLPFLYAEAKPEPLRKHWASFSKQLFHVRNLNITSTVQPWAREGILKDCRRLVRLRFESNSLNENTNPEAVLDYLIQLLQRNPQLIHVSLSLTTPYDSKLWRVLVDDCPRLTEFGLYMTYFQGECLTGFMNLATRLTSLDLENCDLSQLLEWMSSSPSPSSSTKIQNSNIVSDDSNNNNWPGFPVLRTLRIAGQNRINSDWMDQFQIFVRAPRLESLEWNVTDLHFPSVPEDFSGKSIPMLLHMLRQRPWPRLNSLEVKEEYVGPQLSILDDDLAQILTLLPDGLKSLRIPKSRFGLLTWQAIQRHLGTLQVLQLNAPSWMVQGFLTSCPKLRELKGPDLNTSDLVRGVQSDLARRQNANIVAAMLVDRGLPRALIDQLLPQKVFLATDTESGRVSSGIAKSPDKNNLKEEGDPLSVPTGLEYPFPRPWVCHRLKVFHISLVRDIMERESDREEADAQILHQLRQMRYLEELYLCPLAGPQRFNGLSPRRMLGPEFGPPDFRGHFTSAASIRKHPVGERLLEIWPGLTRCHWHKRSG